MIAALSGIPAVKPIRSFLLAAAGMAAVFTLAVANAAGYRFGVSDQAFYLPAVYLALDPTLFPHDREIIHPQGPLLAFDDLTAIVTRATGIDLPVLFLCGYGVALLALFGGAWLIGRRLYSCGPAAAALVVGLTLRHQIPGTSVNTFEGYLHPRMLAFGLGVLAVALFLRDRWAAALLVVVAASFSHPTTAAWFGIWLAVAALASPRASRRTHATLVACGTIAITLLVYLGLERGAQPMGAEWMAAATRRYLFFHDWPFHAWVVHACAVALVVVGYRLRVAAGLVGSAERGLLMGAFALLACVLVAIPLVEARIPLAVQLQPGRIFWIWNFLATVYLVWLLAEAPVQASRARAYVVVGVLLMIAGARGAYIMNWEFPDRPLIRKDLPSGEWREVMAWAASTPVGTHFLVDPAHAWRYGIGFRIGARRDVFLEASKDPALASYSEAAAIRLTTRTRDLGDFNTLDATRARAVAEKHDLDYLIAERAMNLPVVRQVGPFTVYALRGR
jgi:hypothetical protein